MYLILSSVNVFLGKMAVFSLGIFVILVSTGVFIGGAEKKLREEKIDKLIDKKLKSEK